MEVADISAFAKSLREQIGRLDHKPSHVEMLNALSKAGGFRNYQHFRSAVRTTDTLQEWSLDAEASPALDEARVKKTMRVFDGQARITRWPGKRSQQELCLWFLWSRIPSRETFTERGISALLNTFHLFEDPALLRRDLVDLGLMRRNRDGSDYRQVEKKPPPELGLLTQLLGEAIQKAA